MIVVGFLSCRPESNVCEIKSLFTLGIKEVIISIGVGHEHYILVKDFPRSCLDSALIMTAANNYRDTIQKAEFEIAMPVSNLRFYNSDKNFLWKTASGDNRNLNRSCLVAIIRGYFGKPDTYVFYNDKGDIIYTGNKWLKSK